MMSSMPNALILVINCGSSSVKFALYNSYKTTDFKPVKLIAEGIAELLTEQNFSITLKQAADKAISEHELTDTDTDFHSASLHLILSKLNVHYELEENLLGIGHRVVHGGEFFHKSVLIDNQVLEKIRHCVPLAPLHNPANITGIELLKQAFPNIPQAAVFDTAFHQSMPAHAYTYAIPKKWTEQYQIRRYGFHGTSHRFVAQQAAFYLEKNINDLSCITAHLGNGASVAAIKNGISVDTSMGLTPLEGLVMGTRSGDIDPGLFEFLENKGFSTKEITRALNKESGLLGLSGVSHDMRSICNAVEQGQPEARLALEVFCFRAAKYIAAMMTSLTSLDALIFTGGIGEHATKVRELIVSHLAILGFKLNTLHNHQANAKNALALPIHDANSHPILIIATDEEVMIVSDTLQLIQSI